jgi:hypothetical protein
MAKSKQGGKRELQQPNIDSPLRQLAAKYDPLKFYDYSKDRDQPVKRDEKWERQEAFIDCYIACHGHISKSCEMARISRNAFYMWLREEPEFAERLHSRKLEWESQLHAKAAVMALNGNATMLKFLLEFLNPYYDSSYRTKALELMQREAINDKYPIPQPTILPPKIPDRIVNAPQSPTNEPESDE